MPPLPVTPSPHRFAVKKEAPVRTTLLPQEHTPRPTTQQFNSTPRFNFPSTPRPIASQKYPGPTHSAVRFVIPVGTASKAEDIIQESSDDILLPDIFHDVHDLLEIDDSDGDPEYLPADGEDEYKLEEPSSKRRRLSSSPMLLDDNEDHNHTENNTSNDDFIETLSSSPPTRRPISSTASRFLKSTPAPPSTPQSSNLHQTTFLKPHRFRPPDSSEQTQPTSDPLPEQFSPHRKGQIYVAGGLAAEVRDWLFNIESAIPVNVGQKNKDNPWTVRIVVDEVTGGGMAGMSLVRGRRVHLGKGHGTVDQLEIVKIILAGEGTATGLQKGSDIEVGKTVGIKGPMWEVLLEGERWGVGVDWKALP